MNDRLKELAEQAGLDLDVFYDNLLRLSDFAELVRADEREACAVVCEKFTKQVNEMMYPFNGQTAETKFVNSISNIVANTFADAIRARGNK
jgi:hypothetical protein